MQVLRRGSSGPLVARAQSLLRVAGFNPGSVDGRFGPATEAALLGFQRAHDLLADGILGVATWAVLEPERKIAATDATLQLDPTLVAEMFPFTRLDAIRTNLPPVVAGLREFGLTDKPMVLSALATIRAESEGFVPVDEAPSRFNTSPGGREFDLYDYRHDLGHDGPPDGARYRGRGFVQLTGRANYASTGATLGLGALLVERPERAAEPALAGRILAAFLAVRRMPIKEALLDGDLRHARRLVNGGTHGLERFTEAYRIGARLLVDPVWGRNRLTPRSPSQAAPASSAAARAVTAAMSG